MQDFDFSSKEEFELALNNADDGRLLPEGKSNKEKSVKYVQALMMIEMLFSNGNGKATVDDPQKKMTSHIIILDFYEDELDETETKTLSNIISLFDGMMLIGDNEGNVSILLRMDDLFI